MKPVILLCSLSLLFLLNIPEVKSQEFQTVNSGHLRFYKAEPYFGNYQLEDNIQAVKIDSTEANSSGDSAFYFYRMMRDTSFYAFEECILDTIAPCWMGSYAIIGSGGDNFFFNREGDTILIKTHAGLGDSWVFMRKSNFYYQATLDSLVHSIVSGNDDSVKVFSLHAYSNTASPIPDWFNQKTFRLSKNQGFTAFYSLYDFPADTNLFESFAYQPLTIGSVYDFEVGDIFHFENGLNHGGPPIYKVLTILEKWLSSGNDTIYYRKSEKTINNKLIWDPNPHIVTTTLIDTISDVYANPGLLISDLLPHQKKHQYAYDVSFNTLSSILQKWNGRPTISFDESAKYMFVPDRNCFSGAFEPTYFYKSYTKGCGNSYIYQEDQSAFSGSYLKLKYYKKGTEIWGDPYILTSVNEIPNEEPLLEANPNPFTDQIEIRFETKTSGHVSIYLYSITGKLLMIIEDSYKQLGIYTYHPDLSGVTNGIYILKYRSGENISYKKLIKN